MPIYTYQCSKCGKEIEEVRKMKDHALEKPCECGGVFKQVMSWTYIAEDFEPYIDENLGPDPIYVKSKRHRRELMARAGLVEVIQHKYYQPSWKRHRKERRRWREELKRRQRDARR